MQVIPVSQKLQTTHLVCDQGALQDVRDSGYPDIVACVSTLRRKLA